MGSSPLVSTKRGKHRRVLLAFSKRGGSKRAGVNDSLRRLSEPRRPSRRRACENRAPSFPPKGEKHRMVLLAFSKRGGSKRAGLNDSLRGCQSRDDRAGGEPVRIEPPRFHQKGKAPEGAFNFSAERREKRCLIKLKKQNL